MIAAVETIEGVLLVDAEDESVVAGTTMPEPERPRVDLPRVVATAGAGSTVAAVVDRRPPLVVSHDGGSTWRETGGGLPVGFSIAVAATNPDRIVFAARNRLYLSETGGTFWRRLAPELPDILRVAWLDG